MAPFHPLAPRSVVCALALLPMFTALAQDPPPREPSEKVVMLTGFLHVDDLNMRDVLLEVNVDGTVWPATISESGRFSVALPAEVKATLHFVKPGHLPKEVVVDTRHARAGLFGQQTRKVKFAVIMQQERHMAGFTYPGPVGSIGFDTDGGCLAVAHDRNLVPARRSRTMVF